MGLLPHPFPVMQMVGMGKHNVSTVVLEAIHAMGAFLGQVSELLVAVGWVFRHGSHRFIHS